MPDGLGIIATRQDVSDLFSRTEPLSAGQTVRSNPFEAAGYSHIVVSVVSDQPHLISFEEANRPEGPWTPVTGLNSAPIGTMHRAAGRLNPVGFYMRATLQNLGSLRMRSLSAMVYGTAT